MNDIHKHTEFFGYKDLKQNLNVKYDKNSKLPVFKYQYDLKENNNHVEARDDLAAIDEVEALNALAGVDVLMEMADQTECIGSDAKQLISVSSFQYHRPFITVTLKIQQNKIGVRMLENMTLRPIPTWHLDTYSQIKITTQITYYILFTFYLLLSHTAWTSLAACEHKLDVFTAEQYELFFFLSIYHLTTSLPFKDKILALTKLRKIYKLETDIKNKSGDASVTPLSGDP